MAFTTTVENDWLEIKDPAVVFIPPGPAFTRVDIEEGEVVQVGAGPPMGPPIVAGDHIIVARRDVRVLRSDLIVQLFCRKVDVIAQVTSP